MSVFKIFNSICSDCENGEHVDTAWIVDSFDLGGYELITHNNYAELKNDHAKIVNDIKSQLEKAEHAIDTAILEYETNRNKDDFSVDIMYQLLKHWRKSSEFI